MRRAARKDVNQAAIVAALRAIPGCSVLILEINPDLVVGYGGKNFLFEVKRDHKAKLTERQLDMMLTWRGQYHRVESVDDCLWVMGVENATNQQATTKIHEGRIRPKTRRKANKNAHEHAAT